MLSCALTLSLSCLVALLLTSLFACLLSLLLHARALLLSCFGAVRPYVSSSLASCFLLILLSTRHFTTAIAAAGPAAVSSALAQLDAVDVSLAFDTALTDVSASLTAMCYGRVQCLQC